MTRPNNPLYIAKEAQNMAKNAGSSNGQVFPMPLTKKDPPLLR